MNLQTLSDSILLTEAHMVHTRAIVRESCDGLTLDQRRIVEGIYNEFVPLIEATLTAQQIQQVFADAEKSAAASGSNRTMLGKGVDTAKKANEIIDNIGKWLQNTTPVKNFDAKFEKLKNDINTKFPDSKILDGISNMAIWAKENPGKTAAIIGVLTAIASLTTGPVGGAIAGQVLRGSLELLKGEKLSTAIGKGLKTAAVGWLAGKSMEAVGKMLTSAYEYFNPIPIQGFSQFYQENIGNGLPNIFRDAHIVGTKEQLGQFNKMWGGAIKQWNSGDFEGARAAFGQAQDFAAKITADTYNAMGTEDITAPLKNLKTLFSGLEAAAQGAASGATAYDKKGNPVQTPKESVYVQKRPLSEGQVYMVFNRVEQLYEGPMWDKVKGMAGKAAGAVSQKVSQVGSNLTNKITADKLNSAWKAAGSPTDSEEVAKFLTAQGIADDAVKQIYTTLKLPLPGQPAVQPAAGAVDYKTLKDMVMKLDKKGRQRIAAYLQKQLGTA